MKLSKSQEELLEAMRRGVAVHFMSGLDSYYFRSDNHKRCTKQAEALLSRNLIEAYNVTWRGHNLRIKEK